MTDPDRIRVKFEPRDLWIGVYWTREHGPLRIYICFIPCLPMIVTFRKHP